MIEPIDRLPPQNTEAEEVVLGSILMDPEAIGRIRGDLDAADFYRQRNSTLYAAVLDLAARGVPPDMVMLTDYLQGAGTYEDVGGLAYFSHLVGVVPTALHVEHYARIVRESSVRRRLISAAGRIAAAAYDAARSMEEVLTYSVDQIAAAASGLGGLDVTTPEQQAGLLLDMATALAEGRPPGIPSSFPKLNRLTGGYRDGCLYVIGAPTGVGKSAWLATEARWLRSRGKRVLFASSEMAVAELVKRHTAAIVGRDWNELEAGLAKPTEHPGAIVEVDAAVKRMPAVACHVYHGPGMTTDRIRRRAAKMQAEGGLDLLIVDYIQRLADPRGKAETREQQVTAMARALKTIAVDLHLPVLVAAQFSRQVEYRVDKEPQLSDFRESGGIEQEADVAMAIHRQAAFQAGAKPDEAWLYVLKNRHGPGGKRFEMVWSPSICAYGERYAGPALGGMAGRGNGANAEADGMPF